MLCHLFAMSLRKSVISETYNFECKKKIKKAVNLSVLIMVTVAVIRPWKAATERKGLYLSLLHLTVRH